MSLNELEMDTKWAQYPEPGAHSSWWLPGPALTDIAEPLFCGRSCFAGDARGRFVLRANMGLKFRFEVANSRGR